MVDAASGLYEQITEALDVLGEHCEGSEPLRAMRSALRAAVERHKPEPCNYPECRYGQHRVCAECGQVVNHPCPTVQDIAEKLGITEGATP